jgi:peptidoglycan/LPS O-acetylase OafA/YrhL
MRETSSRMSSQPGTHGLPLDPAGNNLNALRFLAASLVILSHGFELPSGLATRDWAHLVTGKAFSWYAVNMFFVISGYLIFASWQRRPQLLAFLYARFLRIVPALFVMLVVTVLLLGAVFSTLSFANFLTAAETVRYFWGCLSIVFVKYELPGVFADNPLRGVNGSLWTLRYEIFCYAAVAVAGVAGFLRSPSVRRAALFSGAAAASIVLISLDVYRLGDSEGRLGMLYELCRLALCFILGGIFYEFGQHIRTRLNFIVPVGAVLLVLLVARTAVFTPVASLAIACLTIWLAFVPNGRWIAWTRKASDYSYGMYIYAFPVQQAIIAAVPGVSFAGDIGLGFVVTLGFAMLSWHLIEKPALSLKSYRLRPSPQIG